MLRSLLPSSFSLLIATAAAAQHAWPGEQPALTPPRVTQAMILSGQLTAVEIRRHGLRMFSTAFNALDGLGDGPMNSSNPTAPSGRPSLQANGMFLRVNGLDAQTCMECHSVMSTASAPFRFGIGGFGGVNNNAMAGPKTIDVDDSLGNGFAAFDGRFINPPFLFGAGGVELLAKEMTVELQRLKAVALANPGQWVPLVAKGVSFGRLRFAQGAFDTSAVEGVEPDLVVRPFGRKGEFATTRAFDIEALQFHLGMEPVEVVGRGVDRDGDGVADEVLAGELSALAVFTTTLEPPVQAPPRGPAMRGLRTFEAIGCADCHVPFLDTESSVLTYSFPEVPTDPAQNVYYAVDLSRPPVSFGRAPRRGLRIPLFSDLKRHDMGPGLAESTGRPIDPLFVTARLWGIADTAPYLHDGRASTLTEAILMHGGEAQAARDAFATAPAAGRADLLAFLRTLRTPESAADDLLQDDRR